MDEGQANPWDTPAAPAPADDSSPSPSPTPPAAAADTPPPAPPAPSGFGQDPNRNRVVVVAVVIFLVILVAGYVLSRPSKSKNSSSTSTTSASATTAAGGGAGGGSTVAGQAASITGTTDTFTRADNLTQLGSLPNGSKWTVQTGTWGIVNDTAYLSGPNTTRRNIAWVGTGYAAGQVQVKISTMAPSAGIVFRYSGPCSYWSIESAPAVASWNIFKVEKCKATQEGNTGYTTVSSGVTIGAIWTADSITVVVNGKIVKTLQNKDLVGAGKVGMVASGKDASKVRFSDFVAGGVKGQGIVKPGKKAGAGTPTTKASGTTPTTTK